MKKIYKEYVDFLNNAKCVYISSILEYKGGQAVQASYSPCIVDEDNYNITNNVIEKFINNFLYIIQLPLAKIGYHYDLIIHRV